MLLYCFSSKEVIQSMFNLWHRCERGEIHHVVLTNSIVDFAAYVRISLLHHSDGTTFLVEQANTIHPVIVLGD